MDRQQREGPGGHVSWQWADLFPVGRGVRRQGCVCGSLQAEDPPGSPPSLRDPPDLTWPFTPTVKAALPKDLLSHSMVSRVSDIDCDKYSMGEGCGCGKQAVEGCVNRQEQQLPSPTTYYNAKQ